MPEAGGCGVNRRNLAQKITFQSRHERRVRLVSGPAAEPFDGGQSLVVEGSG